MTTGHRLSFSELDRNHWCARSTLLTREAASGERAAAETPPPRQLGLLAHGVLESTARAGPWPDAGWEAHFEAAWPLVNSAIPGARIDDWKRLPGVHLVRLTLLRWLSDPIVLEAARAGLEVETPVDDGHRLRGVTDVVVGGPTKSVVWDLKTASAGDAIEDRTRLQLDLYAGLLRAAGRNVVELGVIGKATWCTEPVDAVRAEKAVAVARKLADEVLEASDASTNPTVDGCLSCRWLNRCEDGRDFLSPHGRRVAVLEARTYATGPHALVKGHDDGETRVVGPLVIATAPSGDGVQYDVGDATRIVIPEAATWQG